MPFIVVYCTCISNEQAENIAKDLLNKKLIACANIFPIQSMYWWNGLIENDKEWVLLIKTKTLLWQQLEKAITQIHTNTIPCIIKFEVSANTSYEDWINNETKDV